MRTDSGETAVRRPPRGQDAPQAGQHVFKVGGFLFQQRADVDTGRRPRAAKRDDMLDLRERQAEASRLADEREQAQHVGGIPPIAGELAVRRGQNAAGLVQSQRLATKTAPCGDLANQQPVPLHGYSVKPALSVRGESS